jgi:hypothetical protein
VLSKKEIFLEMYWKAVGKLVLYAPLKLRNLEHL